MSQAPCCPGAPACEKRKAKVDRGKVSTILATKIRPFTVLVAALREIFEESAYERFLVRAQVASSPAAYRDFLYETSEAKARRLKCC
jgi:hypothetical protein